jgi:hypothetical protein
MKTKSETPSTDHRCLNLKCRKSLADRRSDAKFCNANCRNAAQAAEKPESDEVIFISSACRFPRQGQAEIIPEDRGSRHPVPGSRPEFSGYCVVADRCECKCHGEAA